MSAPKSKLKDRGIIPAEKSSIGATPKKLTRWDQWRLRNAIARAGHHKPIAAPKKVD